MEGAVILVENQALLMYHKAREMLVRQRIQMLDGLRGHLAEMGAAPVWLVCSHPAGGHLPQMRVRKSRF